ncbi:hypothetical protein DPPLL_26360 [Desulfofustis limnaeus]|uniref:Uncharacterized protein n=1 Tax=Desulfofustis limnaeus TaxID=2740163 RepID=A0ABM7WBE9_9BACT|nr:hypothetical protein DPPLL_26360 [Desulfofustis limnaeus]
MHNKAQVIGNRITVALPYDLAGVLNGELDFTFPVPLGADFESPFANPFGIVLIDGSDLEFVVDVEFFQSGPD